MISTLKKAIGLVDARRRRRFFAVGLLAIVVSGLEVVSAVLVLGLLQLMLKPGTVPTLPVVGDVLRFFPSAGASSLVFWYCGVFAGFFLLRAAFDLFQGYALARVVENTGVQLASRLVDGYFSMPYEFHLQRNSAELIRNAHDSIGQVVMSVLRPLAVIFAETITVTVMVTVLVLALPLVAVAATAVVALIMVLTYRFSKARLRMLGREKHLATRSALLYLKQGLGGIRDIKILGRERAFSRSFKQARADMAKAMYGRYVYLGLPRHTIETSFLLLIVAAISVATLRGNVESTLSTLGFFAYAGLRLQPSLQKIAAGFNDLRFNDAMIDDLEADLETFKLNSGAVEDRNPQEGRLPFENAVVFQNVSFRYPGSLQYALRDVNLSIPRGTSLGICGPTGSGKTTLLDLLSGLLLPSEGVVTVDGVDIASRSRAWQRNIAMVHQNSFLVDDTLRRNIAFGEQDDEIDEEALDRAVAVAQLREVVDQLPDGLGTVVGELGIRLSGGQRQRVALARAIYRRPRLLILDEGTAALDNMTEAAVMRGLEDLSQEMTLVMVAHRLSSIQRCDATIYIEGGRVLARGTFDELRNSSPQFQAMTASLNLQK